MTKKTDTQAAAADEQVAAPGPGRWIYDPLTGKHTPDDETSKAYMGIDDVGATVAPAKTAANDGALK
jgi:hypothetical protein